MRIATGTYTGNGNGQSITLPFKPLIVFIKCTAQFAGFWTRNSFSSRHNRMAANDSLSLACTSIDTGFSVGTNANTNTNLSTYHYLAIAEDGSQALETISWQGNGVAGLVINQNMAKTLSAIIIKRDNTQSGVVRQKNTTVGSRLDGAGAAALAFVSAYTTGNFTVTNASQVNQADLPNGIGEGTTGLIFYEDTQSKVITWTGDGTASKTIPTGLASIKAALIWADSGTFIGRIKTDTMGASEIADVSNGALVGSELTFTGSDLVTGTGASLNANLVVYHAIVFGPDSGTAISDLSAVPTCATGSGRKVINLPGRGTASRIECGNSDTLKIDGAITIEWMGQPLYWTTNATTDGNEGMLISRTGGGALATLGNVSWALGQKPWLTLGWEVQFFAASTSLLALTSTPDIGNVFRTGRTPTPGNRYMHLMLTQDGSGRMTFYVNGKYSHQRQIDMVAYNGNPNGGSTTGHLTTIGASWVDPSYTNPTRMNFALARTYNRALTAAEVLTRYQRAAQGILTTPDVTSGLVEEWDANNATGTTLTATVNATNNGTIVNGSIVTL